MKTILPLLLLALGLAARAPAEPMTVDGFAAIVNDQVITVGQVLESILPEEERLRLSYSGAELARRRAIVFSNGVQRLVEQQLIVEDFKKNGGTIPDRLVNDRVNEIINDRFNNNRAEFLGALADQRVTLDEWREGIRDRLIVSIVRRQEISDKIRVTPADVREAYEKQKAARFLTKEKVRVRAIAVHKGADLETTRQNVVLLRGRIIAGDDFADMARQHSSGAGASSGGDLGLVETADLRAELRDAVAKLKPGELSPVIDAGDDFFLLKLEERQVAGVVPFDVARPKIEDELKEVEAERLHDAWMDRLRKKHHVQIFEISQS